MARKRKKVQLPQGRKEGIPRPQEGAKRKRGIPRPYGIPRQVQPWEVQHVSAIGLFLRKRTKPVEEGDIKRHFRALYRFGRNRKKVNELKVFLRLSPDALQHFFLKEFGRRTRRYSDCDVVIRKAIKEREWDQAKWKSLSGIMQQKAKTRVLSEKEFRELFMEYGKNYPRHLSGIAENIHAATFRGLSKLAAELGFKLEPETAGFKVSPELKELLFEATRETSASLGNTQELRGIAKKLLGIFAEPMNMQMLGAIQKGVPEESLRKWLSIPKKGLAKGKQAAEAVRRTRTQKSLVSRRARERRKFSKMLEREELY